MATETEALTVSKKVALKHLPRTLKRLVMDAGVRPAFVTVTLTSAPTVSYEAYWRNKVVGLGEETKHKAEYWMGSDGESNSSTKVEFSRVAANVFTKCGSNSKSSASLKVTGLTAETAAAAKDNEVEFLAVLEELVNAHELGLPVGATVTTLEPAAGPETTYTLVDWLTTYA